MDEGVAALTEAFRQNRTAIYAVARRICGEDAAADVTQEVFLRVWKNFAKFDADRGSIRQYLLTIARGVSIDHLRRDASRRTRDRVDVSLDRQPTVDGIQRLLERHDAARVASALALLSPNERNAIVAAFFEEMSYREVALRLGIPEGTAKSRIRLGLQKLRGELRDLRDDAEQGAAAS
ncbi:MAG: sigma-70 family RNA polymerase sigma factor [Ilumatobacteraceae bacterium]